MATPPKKWKVDPLTHNTRIINDDGTPDAFFMQQWNLILQLVKQFTTDNALLERIAAVEIDTTTPIEGGGPILSLAPIAHADSGVTPGVYGDASNVPQITVDEFGHVTDVVDVPIAGGGGLAWTLVGSHDFGATPQATAVFTDLDYSELLAVFVGSTSATPGVPIIRVSTNNGASYYAASGDYIAIPATATASNQDALGGGSSASTGARSCSAHITQANETSALKMAITNAFSSVYFAASTAPIDAIQFLRSGAGPPTITGGIAYLYGR